MFSRVGWSVVSALVLLLPCVAEGREGRTQHALATDSSAKITRPSLQKKSFALYTSSKLFLGQNEGRANAELSVLPMGLHEEMLSLKDLVPQLRSLETAP